MIPANKWLWFGEPGHLVVARRCIYHLHTHIGCYCISTVGDFRPDPKSNDADTIGSGKDDYYETMVFAFGGSDADRWGAFDTMRYSTCIEADAGHIAACRAIATEEIGETLKGDCECKETIMDVRNSDVSLRGRRHRRGPL